MKYNNKFGMQDLFMNKQLKNVFPQFTKKDGLKNVYSFEWVDNKVGEYIKSVFGGTKQGDEIIIPGKFKQRLREIKGMKTFIEDMFNNMPALTKNIRKNTKLFTPFQSVEQLKEIQDPHSKMEVMQIIFDNILYNDDFRFNGRKDANYEKKKAEWRKKVGLQYGKN